MARVETRLDLLRHGEVTGGRRLRGRRTDDPLSARGRADLEHMTGNGRHWDLIAASSLARCHDFARALAAATGGELVVDERFAEYDFGDWDGRWFDQLWAEEGDTFARFLGNPDAVTPPGGESAAAFRARLRAARDDLLARAAGRAVLLIGHGGVLRQLVADVVGAAGNVHAAVDWPPATLSRIRVFDGDSGERRMVLMFHGRAHPLTADST